MKLSQIAFMFITFGILKFMIITSFGTSIEGYTIPQFSVPSFPHVNVCNEGAANNPVPCDATFLSISGILGVIAATADIAIAIYIVVLYIVQLLIFLVLLTVFVGGLLFSTIDGAPWYVNTVMLTPMTLMLGVIVYKMFRKGGDSA